MDKNWRGGKVLYLGGANIAFLFAITCQKKTLMHNYLKKWGGQTGGLKLHLGGPNLICLPVASPLNQKLNVVHNMLSWTSL